MIVKVSSSEVSGSLIPPSSKSSMQRALAAGLMADGITVLSNPSFADDCRAAIAMSEALGAEIQAGPSEVIIKGGLKLKSNVLEAGESGLGVRMFASVAALFDEELTLRGRGTLRSRPMDMIIPVFKMLGADVRTENSYLPITVKGPLRGGRAKMDGSLSSQFLTGLLMALPLAGNDSILLVDSLKSRPYIDMTIKVMSDFGVRVENHDYSEFRIMGRQHYTPCNYRVEEDWSGIAFLAVLGALGGRVELADADINSIQGDRVITEVLGMAGTEVGLSGNKIVFSRNRLTAFNFDISDCPDLAPPLVALASFCEGRSVLTGTERLKVKESDRADCLQKEFSKLGADITLSRNSIEIEGRKELRGARVSSHGDHRIAMALAVSACRTRGTIVIEDAEAVNKSYPGFFNDLSGLGLKVQIINE